MVQVTVGPPFQADGPLPLAPLHNLLSAGNVTVLTPEDEHWLVGVGLWPYPPDVPSVQDPCSDGTLRVKSDGEGWDLPIFGPFTAYLPITCSSITAHVPGFADRARLAMQARESFAVARALSQGIPQAFNPFFADGNTTFPAGLTAVRPDIGLAWLEDVIGDTAQQGLIHATPAVGASWNGTGGGYLLETVSGVLRTTGNGTPVSLDGGYKGARPRFGPATPLAAGTSWAFATGPVAVRRQGGIEVIADDIAQSMDRSDNTVTFRAERGYVASWDAQLQAAVLIDWTP